MQPDVHTRVIELRERVERVWIKPDCGLRTRSVGETRRKLASMAGAAGEVRHVRGL